MPLSPITLRLATDQDVDFISRLIETTMRSYVEQIWGSYSPSRTREAVQESVASNDYSVIESEGERIGALAVEREPTHIQLAQIFIVPSHQNRGVGTHLIRELVREAREAAKPLRIRVLAVNPARRLYEREGFVITSVTPERVFMERHA
jgi:N-acetylglutamate synthase-like GNAT family acetyltransferase